MIDPKRLSVGKAYYCENLLLSVLHREFMNLTKKVRVVEKRKGYRARKLSA